MVSLLEELNPILLKEVLGSLLWVLEVATSHRGSAEDHLSPWVGLQEQGGHKGGIDQW